MRKAMHEDWGSKRRFSRYFQALRLLRNAGCDVVQFVMAATRPNGTVNVSKLLAMAELMAMPEATRDRVLAMLEGDRAHRAEHGGVHEPIRLLRA
jgi:hypothetical protein